MVEPLIFKIYLFSLFGHSEVLKHVFFHCLCLTQVKVCLLVRKQCIFLDHVKQVVDPISVPRVRPVYTNKCFSVGFSYLGIEEMAIPVN